MEFEQLKNLKKGTKFVFIYGGDRDINIFFGIVSKISRQRNNEYVLHHDEIVYFHLDKNTNSAAIRIQGILNMPIEFDKSYAKYYHIDTNKIIEGKLTMLRKLFGANTVKFE